MSAWTADLAEVDAGADALYPLHVMEPFQVAREAVGSSEPSACEQRHWSASGESGAAGAAGNEGQKSCEADHSHRHLLFVRFLAIWDSVATSAA